MAHFTLDHAAIASIGDSADVEARMGRLAHIIAADAATRTPVDTGYLVGSEWVDGAGTEWRIGYDAHYAKYNEFGTYKMRAQPFLSPAAFVYRGSI